MLSKPSECIGCMLQEIGRGFILPEGSGRLGVIGVGESPGANEIWDGLPFRPKAQAGSKFEECRGLAGIPRQDFKIWNLIGCQPPGNNLEPYAEAITHCKVHFDRVVRETPLAIIGKHVFLALGQKPMRNLTADSFGLEARGYVLEAETQREIVEGHEEEFYRPLEIKKYGLMVGTYHPSGVKRGMPHLTPLLAFDMERAVAVANGTFTNYPMHPNFKEFDVVEHPSLQDGWSFYNQVKENGRLVICYDIETPRSGGLDEDARDEIEEDVDIIQIQFAVNTRQAWVFQWKHPFLELIQALFLLPNVKANQFSFGFDVPRLEHAGVKWNGTMHDLMYMFKHWHPRLPRGLQSIGSMVGFPFPWKHEFVGRPEWYGGCDVIADQYILQYLPERMRALGIWQGYLEQIVYMYNNILKKAANRGVPVNEEARGILKDNLIMEREEKNKEIQEYIPDDIRTLTPKRKVLNMEGGEVEEFGYLREPKEIKQARYDYQIALQKMEKEGRSPNPEKTFDWYVRKKYGLVFRDFQAVNPDNGQVVVESRWCKIADFKPSSTQLIKYINWKRESLESD